MKYIKLLEKNKINIENLITEILEICDTYNCYEVKFKFNRENVKNAIEFLSNRKSALNPFLKDLKRYKRGKYNEKNIKLGLNYVIRDIGYYMGGKQTKN